MAPLRVVMSHLGESMVYLLTMRVAPSPAHTQTKQSLQITLHKHALEFEHVHDYLLSRVNSRELTLCSGLRR